MRHEKTVSVSKIRLLWEPWKEDETPRNIVTKSWACRSNMPNRPRRMKILFCNVAYTTVCRPRTFGFADPAVMTPSCATFPTTL